MKESAWSAFEFLKYKEIPQIFTEYELPKNTYLYVYATAFKIWIHYFWGWD